MIIESLILILIIGWSKTPDLDHRVIWTPDYDHRVIKTPDSDERMIKAPDCDQRMIKTSDYDHRMIMTSWSSFIVISDHSMIKKSGSDHWLKKNKSGHTAKTSRGWVGKGGNARSSPTDGPMDRQSLLVASPLLKKAPQSDLDLLMIKIPDWDHTMIKTPNYDHTIIKTPDCYRWMTATHDSDHWMIEILEHDYRMIGTPDCDY